MKIIETLNTEETKELIGEATHRGLRCRMQELGVDESIVVYEASAYRLRGIVTYHSMCIGKRSFSVRPYPKVDHKYLIVRIS